MESGNTIQVQHSSNMVSVYKHNSTLLKKEGETVKAGEAIALVGSSGENSTGPHLHFELWHNGNAVNPADYINF
jgi:murein DD-endopeptidase MepM/ murein hydrolase activator NlpD